MEDSVDELSRSHDRLFPPSSPTKHYIIPEGLGSSPQRKRTHIETSSPARRRQSFVLDTPAPVQHGASRSAVSPMRIRVTVETEASGVSTPLGATETNKQSGTALDFDMGTTTVTIPLKGEDEHKPARRRGRPRKSSDVAHTPVNKSTEPNLMQKPKGTPRPRKNAASTPAKSKQTSGSAKKDNSATKVAEFPDLDTPSARIQISDEPIAKRTRRSSGIGVSTTPTHPPPAAKQPRKRMDFSALTPLHQKKNAIAASEAAPAEAMAFTPWGQRKSKQESAAKKIRERVPTPRKLRPQKVTFSSPVQQDTNRNMDALISGEKQKIDQHDANLEKEDEVQEEEEEEDQIGEDASEGDDVEEDNDIEEDSDDAADDGMTGMEDDTSVLDRSAVESEGFSMVSIDSLQNHRRAAETGNATRQSQSKLRIEQRISEEPEKLQSLGSPNQLYRSPPRFESERNTCSNPVKHDEHIFGAFGPGTRRQLQARLDMGKMLAGDLEETGRQGMSKSSGRHASIFEKDHEPQKQQSGLHRLPTPAEDEYVHEQASNKHTKYQRQPMSLFATQPSEAQFREYQGNHVPITPSTSGHDESFEMSQTQLFQQEVQREREQVVRQAAAANACQVVVLDDTTMHDVGDEEEDQACLDQTVNSQDKSQAQEDSGVGVDDAAEDMWLDEADRSMESSMIPRPARRSLKRKADHDDQVRKQNDMDVNLEDLFPLDTRPPRAKLPRTWRRTSGADFHYSDEIASPAHLSTQTKQSLPPQVFAPVPEDTADVWLDSPVRANGSGRAARAMKAGPASSSKSPRRQATDSMEIRNLPRRKVAPLNAPVSAMANEQYFSESEKQDEIIHTDHDADMSICATDRHDEQQIDDETIHQSIETDILADTSDARQLQLELLATTPAHKRRARSRYNDEIDEHEQHEQCEQRSRPLLRQPGKVYESLFGSPVKQVATQPQKQQSEGQLSTSAVPEHAVRSITLFHHDDGNEKKSNILFRLTSWLFTAPASTTSHAENPSTTTKTQQYHPAPQCKQTTQPTKSSTPTWNRNHYLLLDHHYTRVLHSTTQPLPSAYMTPWSLIPSPLRKLLGTKLMTTTANAVNIGLEDGNGKGSGNGSGNGNGHGKKATHPATITEQWIRIAYCFVAEAKERGVPVLCDGSFAPLNSSSSSSPDERGGRGQAAAAETEEFVEVGVAALESEWQGQTYPVRDEITGRVKRVKQECWGDTDEGAWDVLGRVYSLWVRDEIVGVGRGVV